MGNIESSAEDKWKPKIPFKRSAIYIRTRAIGQTVSKDNDVNIGIVADGFQRSLACCGS